jgi:hypothetical protein
MSATVAGRRHAEHVGPQGVAYIAGRECIGDILTRVARRRLFISRHNDLLDVAGNATAGSRAVGGDCQISLKKLHQLFRFPDLRLDKFVRKQLARPSRVERKGVKKRCLSL